MASTRVVADTVVTGEPKTGGCAGGVARQETVRALSGGACRPRSAWPPVLPGRDPGLVFVDELSRWWREAVARAEVPPVRLDDARHTAPTMLLRAGVPVKVVAQRLGRADVAVHMRVYQHVTRRTTGRRPRSSSGPSPTSM